MPDPNLPSPPNRTAPAVLITIAAVGILLGIGRCGFLGHTFRQTEDYGIGGAILIVIGLVLLVTGLMWFHQMRQK